MSATNEHSARIKTALILLGILAVVGLVDAPWAYLALLGATLRPEPPRGECGSFRTAQSALTPAAAGDLVGSVVSASSTDMIFAAAW